MSTADGRSANATGSANSLWPAIAVALFGMGIAAYAFYAPPPRGEMAVVFAPGTSAKTAYLAILAAGGRFVAPTRLDNIAVAYAEDERFGDRIRSLGGLFTLAAHGLCEPANPTESHT
ncbi:hypothetical protein [Devosia sp.]|uniref:hypothetical protein n=1 Tax=Devosia sp. TaxID=1871048 RepID=UPI003BAD63D7